MAAVARPGGDEHGGAVLDAREQDRLIGGIGRNAEAGGGLHADIGGDPRGPVPRPHPPCGRGFQRGPAPPRPHTHPTPPPPRAKPPLPPPPLRPPPLRRASA